MQYERICIKGASIDNQECTKLGSCLNHRHFFFCFCKNSINLMDEKFMHFVTLPIVSRNHLMDSLLFHIQEYK